MSVYLSCSGSSDHLLESFDEYDISETERKKDRIVESNNYSNSSGSSSGSGSSSKSLKGDRSTANVMLELLGPIVNMRIRSIKKTVWFWGILLGTDLVRTYTFPLTDRIVFNQIMLDPISSDLT